jgi:thiol-disulfide isomerase/thioredoxin
MMPILGGEETRLLDLKNRYLLIDFWATWCNDCKLNNTKLRDIFVQYSPKGFGIVQFSLDFDQKILTDYYTEFEIPWKMAFDPLQWDSPILEQLSVNSIPSNYLIDRLGVIKARNISPQELQELLTKLLP